LGATTFWQPLAGWHVSMVQALPSSQVSGVPVQTPPWQISLPVQTLPSLHDVPSGAGVFEHPEAGSQASVVHALASLQLSAAPALHTPLWQVSSPLHTSPSVQGVPFRSGVWRQPRTGWQLSVVQTLASLQLGGVPAVHTPLWQVSVPLQTSASAQETPLGSGGFPHTPAVHTSPVHGLPSAQVEFTTHVMQPGMGVCWQPLVGWQVSVVQPLLSAQLGAVPAVHTPL
jgi:hypothetical protein